MSEVAMEMLSALAEAQASFAQQCRLLLDRRELESSRQHVEQILLLSEQSLALLKHIQVESGQRAQPHNSLASDPTSRSNQPHSAALEDSVAEISISTRQSSRETETQPASHPRKRHQPLSRTKRASSEPEINSQHHARKRRKANSGNATEEEDVNESDTDFALEVEARLKAAEARRRRWVEGKLNDPQKRSNASDGEDDQVAGDKSVLRSIKRYKNSSGHAREPSEVIKRSLAVIDEEGHELEISSKRRRGI